MNVRSRVLNLQAELEVVEPNPSLPDTETGMETPDPVTEYVRAVGLFCLDGFASIPVSITPCRASFLF